MHQQCINLRLVKWVEILSRISNDGSFIVPVMLNQEANRKNSNFEELVKHATSELTEFDEASCNNIMEKLVNENKLIKKKYEEKDTFSLPSTKNKTDSNEMNPDIADFQAEILVLKEFVLSEFCLLKKEAMLLPTSRYVSKGKNNSSDPPNAVANKRLLEKLEKGSSLLRGNLQKITVYIKTSTYVLYSKIFDEPTGHIFKEHNMR